jgi:hypothetical protein
MLLVVLRMPYLLCIVMFFKLLPGSVALSDQNPFPDIKFATFNKIILNEFSPDISLATVISVLFTIMENTDLLNLHARQQYSLHKEENCIMTSSWIKQLSQALYAKLQVDNSELLQKNDFHTGITANQLYTNLGKRLDHLAKSLNLIQFNSKGRLKPLNSISYKKIDAAYVLSPPSYECQTKRCKSRSLRQISKNRDIPLVTLVKNNTILEHVPVLVGECLECHTSYHVDHERYSIAEQDERFSKVYLNSARYLKVGANVWVDRVFSNAAVNSMYHFHASTSAYTEFWNSSYWKIQDVSSSPLTRRHVWQSFVQESIRTIAAVAGLDIELRDDLAIDEIPREAFTILGENGVIRAAAGHACSECTQEYRAASTSNADSDDALPVRMVVVDGIVTGPKHCAYDNCTSELENNSKDVFCEFHNQHYGSKCRIKNCPHDKIKGTQACLQHSDQWKQHEGRVRRRSAPGFRKITQRKDEKLAWVPNEDRVHQPHDEDVPERSVKNYFNAPRFYCVETVCNPCGVVIAWKKFPKAESPTNILTFLEEVFPTAESRPDYICIDKACLVLRSAIRNNSWDRIWKHTTRFIVDSYHYMNHRTTDELCRKWCNPAPDDGSAPNLVIEAKDKDGKSYFKRAFNTQACEQLNAWLGGYEPILNRMTCGNFDWFLHVMLFIHTTHVIATKKHKADKKNAKNNADDGYSADTE